ncbi:MAG: zinc ribbon domain-containing protein [Fimbriimonadales bacterium]
MINQALKKIGRVQKIDSLILELQRKFSLIDPGRGAQAAMEQAKASLEQAESKLKTIRTEVEDLELQSKSFEQKMVSEKNRLYSGGVYNAKDAEAIERELANLNTRRGQADDRILELWEQVEPAKVEMEIAMSEFDAASAKVAEYAAKYEQVRAEFEEKLGQLNIARTKEVAEADTELLSKYDAMRKKRAGIGVAAVIAGVCSACHTSIPTKQLGDLKLGDTLETCENCLRFIYYEEEG